MGCSVVSHESSDAASAFQRAGGNRGRERRGRRRGRAWMGPLCGMGEGRAVEAGDGRRFDPPSSRRPARTLLSVPKLRGLARQPIPRGTLGPRHCRRLRVSFGSALIFISLTADCRLKIRGRLWATGEVKKSQVAHPRITFRIQQRTAAEPKVQEKEAHVCVFR